MKPLALPFALAGIGILVFSPSESSAGDAQAAETAPTYAEHIAPILNRACVECHRPGEVAPFSLVGYEESAKRAKMLAFITESRRMPPWKAVPGHGEFLDENRLSVDEIALIRRWAEAGAPRGDASKEPKPPVFSSEWTLGEPDLIVGPTRPFRLSAEGRDEYRYFTVKTDFKEPVYVTAMDVRPGNKRVVHHVIAFLDNRGASQRMVDATTDGQEGYPAFGGPGFMPDGSLGGWAPGLRARHTPPGTGFKVEPGASIVLQVHYNKTGKEEVDQTKVALYFAKEPVRQEMQLLWLANPTFRIPAGDPAHRVTLNLPVPVDMTLHALMPHMHLLGRSMKATLRLPDGTRRPLIYIDDWDFNWQMMYALREPLKLPRGSWVEIEAVYDNSEDNPLNPSAPPRDVRWGEQTTDEMFLLVAAVTMEGELPGRGLLNRLRGFFGGGN
jgi:mono/diheme cytochrome c family protein